MKTKVKVANRATGSLDEVIFKNRNKAYGAYELRKKYRKHLFIGFIFAFLIFGTGVSVPLINSLFAVVEQKPLNIMDSIRIIDRYDPETPPPPPPPTVDLKIERQISFRQPVVVDSAVDTEGLLTNDDILENPIDNDISGLDVNKTKNDRTNEIIDIDADKERVVVEESAVFDGGSIDKFHKWVSENITYPKEAIDIDLSGRVFVSFCVDRFGNICDVRITRGVHPSLDEAVVRTIMSSPKKWIPAKQNGMAVKQLFSMPILFQEVKY